MFPSPYQAGIFRRFSKRLLFPGATRALHRIVAQA